MTKIDSNLKSTNFYQNFNYSYRASRGTPFYRIDPESSKFDIAPIAGDIFATTTLNHGIYEFFVVAVDTLGQVSTTLSTLSTSHREKHYFQESKAKIKVIVGDSTALFKSSRKTRTAKRDRASDVFIALKEDHPLGFLNQQVALFADERIDGAPLTSEYLMIFNNGSIELIQPLNYEKLNEIHVNIPITGDFNSKFKKVIIVKF